MTKVTARFDNPLDQEVTITATLTLGQWSRIKDQLAPLSGSHGLWAAISEAIGTMTRMVTVAQDDTQ